MIHSPYVDHKVWSA